MCLIVAYAMFVIAPLLLWLLATGFTPRQGNRKFLSLISGHDGRLSLSRVQAAAWTLVIFGAWCAAMTVHPFITVVPAAERQARETAAKDATANLKTLQPALQLAKNADAAAAKQLKAVQDAAAKASLPDQKKAADNAVTVAKTAADKAHADLERANAQVDDAQKKIADYRAVSWVTIPAELLLLAGISLASGVFASVISAAGNANTGPPPTPPSVTGVTAQAAGAAIPPNAKPNVPLNNRAWLKIDGAGLGSGVSIRIDGKPQLIAYWLEDGSSIGVIGSPPPNPYSLIVDSKNGKVAYDVNGGVLTPVVRYEWGDLFRDDNEPQSFSLMKFQMFGWTIVALIVYAVIFLGNLGNLMDTLPTVDSTIVMLTGVSQAGYLAGKGASNLTK